ncbi:MAG: hypothetical protein ACI4EJ_07710 [Bacteroides sp.]
MAFMGVLLVAIIFMAVFLLVVFGVALVGLALLIAGVILHMQNKKYNKKAKVPYVLIGVGCVLIIPSVCVGISIIIEIITCMV